MNNYSNGVHFCKVGGQQSEIMHVVPYEEID